MPHTNIKHLDIQDGRIFGQEQDIFSQGLEHQTEFIIMMVDEVNSGKAYENLMNNNVSHQEEQASEEVGNAKKRKVLISLLSKNQEFTIFYFIEFLRRGGQFTKISESSWMVTEKSEEMSLGVLDDKKEDIFVQIQVKSIEKLTFGLHGFDYHLEKPFLSIVADYAL